MGREALCVSRYHPDSSPFVFAQDNALAPTTIGFPITRGLRPKLQVTQDTYLALRSYGRLKRELQLGSGERNLNNYLAHLWRLLPVYFPLSQPLFLELGKTCCPTCRNLLLHSRILNAIICEIEGMSRLGHGFSKVRKFLTRITRKVRMNANFFLFAKIRPLRAFRVKTAPQN